MEELFQYIKSNNIEGVKELLAEHPELAEREINGTPICFYGAKEGNLDMVKYFVEYSRASMNAVDETNRNILHYGAMSGKVSVCRYLVEKVGMDITSGDHNRVTPYEIAHEMRHLELEAYFENRIGAAIQNMYKNPIRTGMFPDPSIVRVGEDYYSVNSSFIFFPCIPISHSKDLIHWDIIGHAITNPEWAALEELEGGRGYWAPDISYDKGVFYITATYRLNDIGPIYRKQIIVASKQPEGPYSKPAIIDEDGIDPSIFHDDDGRHYMLLNRGARILELNEDCTKQISEAQILYYGDCKRAPEGPHLLKKDGFYYLFLAEGGTGPGHRITVARSNELMGNYEPCPYNPIMYQKDSKAAIQRCGHGKPVMTQNGDWYMIYLCGRMIGKGYSILGRETALDPITWTADGWPIVNGLKGPSVLQKKPKVGGENGIANGQKKFQEEDFSQPELALEWMTPRPPEKEGIILKNGRLYLKGSREPLAQVGARNILLRRQTDFMFRAEAEFGLTAMKESQEIGMTCYYDENTWLCFYVKMEQETYQVYIKEHIGEEDREYKVTKYIEPEMLESGKYITFSIETDYLKRNFYYLNDYKERKKIMELSDVYYLCDEGLKMGKRFTGAMVGLYAFGGAETYYGEFHKFSYKELSSEIK